MADEAVALGGAGGSSGSGGGAPPGGSGGGSPAGGNGAPAARQTDEQILGMDPVGTAPAEEKLPVPQTEQEKAAAAAKAAEGQKTPEEQAAEAARVAEEAKAIPAKWQELAKTDPEFRTLVVTAKANADKLATIEPKFKEFEAIVADTQRADQNYLSGDPVAIANELKTFIGDKPEALEPMFEAGLNLLKETNPQGYQSRLEQLTQETLRSWGFDKAFQVLRNAMLAGDQGLPVLKEQVEKILEFVDGNGFPTTEKAQLDARTRAIEARETTERQRDEQNYNSTAQTFRTSVNTKITESLQPMIKGAVDKFLEKSAFPDGAKARIAADVGKELDEMLRQNKDIVDQIGKAIWPNGSKDREGKIIRGAFNDTNRDLAIKLPVEYAKTVLNDVLKKVVEQYTKDFMATQQTQEKRLAAAASKTEVSGGGPAERGKRPLKKEDVDYSKMSDEQILDA